MFSRIYNILQSFMGESKQLHYDTYTNQYQWNCPYCADEKGDIDYKYNLETNLSMGKFHCWSCNNSGNISKLIKEKSSYSNLEDYITCIEQLKECKYLDINKFRDKCVSGTDKILKLPDSFRKIDISKCGGKLKEFLDKRNITQDIIDFYNIGFTRWEENDKMWSYKVIIPSYNSYGELNYFVGRDYTNKDKVIKYKNCDADKKKIVFQESKIEWDNDIYLCEGVLDAIRYPNTISLLGKTLTGDSELYNKLIKNVKAYVIICLDADTTIDETKKIYKLLNNSKLKGRIKYINIKENSQFKDFSEIYENSGKIGLIELFKKSESFNEIELT